MTDQAETKEGQGEQQAPKSRIEVLEEAVLELVDKVEKLATDIANLQKTAVKKSTQRLGAEHGRKAVKDTTTGNIYPSKFAAGKAIASSEDLKDAKGEISPLDNFAYYRITKLFPDRLVEATDEEAEAAYKKADAELQAAVDEQNKKLAEEAAKNAGQGQGQPAQKPQQQPKKGK
jgi:hypothetical protein